MTELPRRSVLLGGLAGLGLVAGCGGRAGQAGQAGRKGQGGQGTAASAVRRPSLPRYRAAGVAPGRRVTRHRIPYGPDRSQYAELGLPQQGRSRGTVVLVHGGGWEAPYLADQMWPMAEEMQRRGLATWNVEYRRLDAGGGWPRTHADVGDAVDRLATLQPSECGTDPRTLRRRVIVVGHSAGGQLAVWAASRTAHTPGGPPLVRPRGVVSLSGPLDLTAYEAVKGPGADNIVDRIAGGTPRQVPGHYDLIDPVRLVPSPALVLAAHGRADTDVPRSQSTSYVAAARRAHGRAVMVDVPGTHEKLPYPDGPAWPDVVGLIERALRA